MSKKFVKSMALFTALSLSISLFAGCGSNNAGTDSTASASTSAQASASVAKTPELNKEAKIRIGVPDNTGVKGLEEGATENNNQFINAIREKTGYKNVEWNIVPMANELDKYNLMFASGDVYDIIYNFNLEVFRRFNGQGALQPVDDYVKQFGSEINSLVTEDAWALVTSNGQKFGIPVPAYQKYNNVALGSAFMVRQDYMDKLGLKAPANTDELYTFLKTIKEKDPSGKGTVPYVANAGNNGNPFDGLDGITGAFGLSQITNMAVPFIVKDGKLVDAQDVYLKSCLEYLAKLYKEGLIDNEYLFNKTQQMTEKLASGKAASAYQGYWDVSTLQKTLNEADPNAKLTFIPPVAGPDGSKGYYMGAPANAYYMVPKGAKYANEAVDLLNSYLKDKDLQSFVSFGKEGTHYTKSGDVITPIQPAYDNIKYKIYYRMWTTADIWLPNAIMGGYEEGIKSYTANGDQLTRLNINQYRPQTDVELSKSKTLIDLRNEYAAKIISGALPLTAIDEYFKKADAAGRQEVIQASQEWFEKDGKAIAEKLSK